MGIEDPSLDVQATRFRRWTQTASLIVVPNRRQARSQHVSAGDRLNHPDRYAINAAMLRKLAAFLAWGFGLIVVAIFSGWITMNTLIKGEVIRVPDVVGKTTEEAYKTLSDSGLYMSKTSTQPDERLAPDRIISQDPASGTTIKKNRKVKVVVSSGSETVVVPDLLQKSARTASLVLGEAGLKLGLTAQSSSTEVVSGEVMAQEPAPGGEEIRGATVNILVSIGPPIEYYLMPDLIGRDVKEVASKLRDLGFQIGNIRSQEYLGVKPGTVIRQVPLAGYRVQKTNLISLDVCRE